MQSLEKFYKYKNDKKIEGCVYFIKLKSMYGKYYDNIYKIGKTQGLKERLISIQWAMPFEIEVYTTFYSDRYGELERHFHKSFASKNIRGERYKLKATDLRKIHDVFDNFNNRGRIKDKTFNHAFKNE